MTTGCLTGRLTVAERLDDVERLRADTEFSRCSRCLAGTSCVAISASKHRRANQQTPVTGTGQRHHHSTAHAAFTLRRRVHVS